MKADDKLQDWLKSLEDVEVESDLSNAIVAERRRQEELHPGFPSFDEWRYLILAEEVGEVAKAILEHDVEEMKKEIVEVAAVCCRWWTALEDEGV